MKQEHIAVICECVTLSLRGEISFFGEVVRKLTAIGIMPTLLRQWKPVAKRGWCRGCAHPAAMTFEPHLTVAPSAAPSLKMEKIRLDINSSNLNRYPPGRRDVDKMKINHDVSAADKTARHGQKLYQTIVCTDRK